MTASTEGHPAPDRPTRTFVDPAPTPDSDAPEKVANAVLEIDRQKVKDCTDDIDTLLLVAGLFAAVLTPLLVESYQTLREDPLNTVISLLRQIIHQTDSFTSFTITHNFVNMTVSLAVADAGAATFTPSGNAKRVNVLWFLSLVLSLATASFCITVKQWLRDYLSGELIAPLARLRTRNRRYPALMKWRVFKIAAMLPLLLQVALALFFVGLCYFTADVHELVGHTTLPVVALWAFLFGITVLIPIFYPNCPYKTPYLKAIWNIDKEDRVANETDAARNDILTFTAIDRDQRDDQFLTGLMWRALITTHRDPLGLSQFILAAASSRLGWPETKDVLIYRFPEIRQLRSQRLSSQTCGKLAEMVASIMTSEFQRRSLDDRSQPPNPPIRWEWSNERWLEYCLFFLLSDFVISYDDFVSSSHVDQALHDCLTSKWRLFVLGFIRSKVSWDGTEEAEQSCFRSVLQKLRGGLALVSSTRELLIVLNQFFLPSTTPLGQSSQQSDKKLYTFITNLSPGYSSAILDIFIQRIRVVTMASTEESWAVEDRELFLQICDFPDPYSGDTLPKQPHPASRLVQDLLLSPKCLNTVRFYQLIVGKLDRKSTLWRRQAPTAVQFYRDAFLNAEEADRTRILYRFLICMHPELKLDSYASYDFDSRKEIVPMTHRNLFETCLLHLNIIASVIKLDESNSEAFVKRSVFWVHRELWNEIFAGLANELRQVSQSTDSQRANRKREASRCKNLIDKITAKNSKNRHIFPASLTEVISELLEPGPSEVEVDHWWLLLDHHESN